MKKLKLIKTFFYLAGIWILIMGFSNAQVFTGCQLFPGFVPNFIPLGETITGYSQGEATMDYTCSQFLGTRTCNSTYTTWINTYKYPSCKDQERDSCTIPGITKLYLDKENTGERFAEAGKNTLEHNEVTYLFSAEESNFDESCSDLDVLVKCRDGDLFIWNTTQTVSNEYRYLSCEEQTFVGCMDTWNNKFVDHGGVVGVYTKDTSTNTALCSNFRANLTCKGGDFYDSQNNIVDESEYFGNCNNVGGLSCVMTRADKDAQIVSNGSGVLAYSQPSARNCADEDAELTCNEGRREGGSTNYYKYSKCNQGTESCWYYDYENSEDKTANNGDTLTRWKNKFSYSCSTETATMTCLNGKRTDGSPSVYKYSSCSNGEPGQCWMNRSDYEDARVINGDSIQAYHSDESRYCDGPVNYKEITCDNGSWIGGNISYYSYHDCYTPNGSCDITWADLNRTDTFGNGETTPAYSTISSWNCSDSTIKTTLKCVNGEWEGGSTKYFSYQSCEEPDGNCDIFRPSEDGNETYLGKSGNRLSVDDGASTGGYHLPESRNCSDDSNFRELQCVQGSRSGGNPNYFQYESCSSPDGNCTMYWTDIDTGSYSSGTIITGYSQGVAYWPYFCSGYVREMKCDRGSWIGGNPNYFNYYNCINSGSEAEPPQLDMLGVDLQIVSITLNNNNMGMVLKGGNPIINIEIRNNGLKDFVWTETIPEGFLSCYDTGNNELFKSEELSSFYLLAQNTRLATRLYLNSRITKETGPKEITCIINQAGEFFQEGIMDSSGNYIIYNGINFYDNNSRSFYFEVVESFGGRFDMTMSQSIQSIERNLDTPETRFGADGVKSFIIRIAMNILVPVVIVLSILIAILGLYKIMFQKDEDATSKGIKYILRGVIGIIIIMSAKFIGNIFYETIPSGKPSDLSGIEVAANIYKKIFFPFIKMAIYLVLGVMFIILISRIFTFFMSGDEDAAKKAKTIIIRNIIGILVIIGSKQIVEVIFGKQAEVLDDNAQNLGDIGGGILADKNIPLLYHIVNWVMGLTALLILIIIIVQTFKLLTDPENPENVKKIGKSIGYIVLGVIIIGTGYLIVNFLVIN